MDSKCCVCMNCVDVYQNLSSWDFLISKLRDLVPEEEWSEDYNICEQCTTELERAYEFRQLCIRYSLERKTALLPKLVEIFTCYHCGSTFNDKEILTEHVLTHQEETKPPSPEVPPPLYIKICKPKRAKRTFSCEVCDVVMPYAKQIVEHCCNEHSMDKKLVKPYKCDECLMRFISSTNLIQHKKYHEGNRSHVCSICGKSYITKSDLTVHEYTHFNRRNYKCDVCGKAFNTNKNLRSHMLVVHTDSALWKFGCDVCSRRFPLMSGFKQHMKRHMGEKEFVCHICAKSFVTKSELQKHMRYHSMVKPFRCEHCDKSYKDKRMLDVHLMKSHGIGNVKIPVKQRKFACGVCSNGFFDRHKLERHMQTHARVKPYVCLQCNKKYSDKYYFKLHMKNVHGLDGEGHDFETNLVSEESKVMV